MPRAKPILQRVEKPVTFYSYTQTDKGFRLADKTKIVLYAKEIIDPRTNTTSFDKLTQRVAVFSGGIFQTDIKDDIKTLENYHIDNPKAKIIIKKELLGDQDGTKIIEKTVTTKVVPLSVVKGMSPNAIAGMMKDIWDYKSESSTVAELIDEGTQKGFFQ